jgi:hypothetical protein
MKDNNESNTHQTNCSTNGTLQNFFLDRMAGEDAISDPQGTYRWLKVCISVCWITSLLLWAYPLLALGRLKRLKKPVLNNWLIFIPEFKLELTHPTSVLFGTACFFYGYTMLIFAIDLTFQAFRDDPSCRFYSRSFATCIIFAYFFLMLLLLYRAETALTPAQVNFKKFVRYFMRPFMFCFLIWLLVVANLDQYNVFMRITSSDGHFWCYSIPGNLITSSFIVGDSFVSVGLFISFYFPLRKVMKQSKEALSVSQTDMKGDLDSVIIRNFKSFVFLWIGTTGTMVIFHFAGTLTYNLNSSLKHSLTAYSALGLTSCFLIIGGVTLVWKTLDFQSTIYAKCFKVGDSVDSKITSHDNHTGTTG